MVIQVISNILDHTLDQDDIYTDVVIIQNSPKAFWQN